MTRVGDVDPSDLDDREDPEMERHPGQRPHTAFGPPSYLLTIARIDPARVRRPPAVSAGVGAPV